MSSADGIPVFVGETTSGRFGAVTPAEVMGSRCSIQISSGLFAFRIKGMIQTFEES